MRKKIIKTAAVTVVVAILVSIVFSVPISASSENEDGVEWWEHGTGRIWDLYWRALEANQDLYWDMFVQDRISWSEKTGLPNYFTQTRDIYTSSGSPGGGGGGGVRGEGPTAGGGGGGGVRGHVDAAATGSTASYSLTSYNTTTNSYTFNMPTYNYNYTTNNYYETYNIQNIYYNNTYNTYHFQTTNNYNYYVTYSPTYININYLDSSSTLCDFTYYFQLPDGRNSWDLTASEVYGMYFMYDAVNYDMVVEDDATLALYHFDGNINDSSSYGGSAKYTVGGSQNYVDHGQFNQALYWGNGEQILNVSLSSGGAGTIEVMSYFSFPTNMGLDLTHNIYAVTDETRNGATSSGYNLDHYNWPKLDYYINGATYSLKDSSGWSSESFSTLHRVLWSKTETYDFKQVLCYLVTMGDKQFFPIYQYGTIQLDYSVYTNASNPYSVAPHNTSNKIIATVKSLGVSITDRVKNQNGFGEWVYLAAELGDGQQYINGIPVDMPEWIDDVSGSSGGGGGGGGVRDGNTVILQKPYEWNNYWYIDELRVSSGSLYSGYYNPQSHPFDTNKVMVLPESGNSGDIAIKSNIPVRNFRVGGARPTYPVTGDVYISIEKTSTMHKVESVQQYQSGGWVAVDGSIRVDGEWLTLKSYDLKSFTIDETEVPDPGGSSGGGDDSGGGDGDLGDPSDSGFWAKLGEVIVAIVTGLLSLIGQLVSGIATIITTLFDALFSLVGFTTRFGEFVGAAFAFIPQEIIGVIVVGLTLAIILMIINFFR